MQYMFYSHTVSSVHGNDNWQYGILPLPPPAPSLEKGFGSPPTKSIFAHWSTIGMGWVLFTEQEWEIEFKFILIIAGGDRVRRARAEFAALALLLLVADEPGGGHLHPPLLPHPPQKPLLLHAARLPARARLSLSAHWIGRSADQKVQAVSSLAWDLLFLSI